MFIKQIVTAVAVVAAACVSIPEAKAGLDHKAIAAKLHSIGVTTEFGDCGSNVHGPALGTYNSRDNHFCISNEIPDMTLFNETVVHEVIHVVQDCIGGGIASPEMASITRYLSDGDVEQERLMDRQLIADLHEKGKLNNVYEWTSHLPDESKFIEIEAYHLETSPLFVMKLLNKCTPK